MHDTSHGLLIIEPANQKMRPHPIGTQTEPVKHFGLPGCRLITQPLENHRKCIRPHATDRFASLRIFSTCKLYPLAKCTPVVRGLSISRNRPNHCCQHQPRAQAEEKQFTLPHPHSWILKGLTNDE